MSTKWTIARAREKFSELLRKAQSEPQPIYNRDRLVAAVVDAESYEEFARWRAERKAKTIADSFAELRKITAGEDLPLEAPAREDRENAFARSLEDKTER